MVVTRRKGQAQQLFVAMNGVPVGVLERLSGGKLTFQYDLSWLDDARSRPISLSMPITDQPYSGEVVENYFDNLLPDNENIRRRIRTRFNAKSTQCYDLLSEIGADCVGALQLQSESIDAQPSSIAATPMGDTAIAQLLQHYRTAPLGMEPDTDFRISIAGAQEKTALLWHKNAWHRPHGTTPTSHIFKLPMGVIQHSGMDLSDSVENEWFCLQVLSAFGLAVNNAQIAHFDGTKTLVVERFDRRWTKDKKTLLRLPQEDMCQALGVFADLKYQSDGGPGIINIMEVLAGSYNAIDDRMRFMRSVFLFWFLGAIDGHAKNFSISIAEQGRFTLTPLYDVISAYPLVVKSQLQKNKIKMAMAVHSKNVHYRWQDIQLRHWFATADLCKFPRSSMQQIVDQSFDEMEAVIEQVYSALPASFPSIIAESITDNMRKLKQRFKAS